MKLLKMEKENKKALVVFSGGQDSTTCLYWALGLFEKVEAITFNYGQKHKVELVQSAKICFLENIKQTVVDISFLPTLVESALTSGGDVNRLNEKGLPDSFVPNRNQLFVTLAHAYAQKVKADAIILGCCETDYSGYPDCRRSYIDILELTSNEGSDSNIKILTPLMTMTKANIFLMAEAVGCLEKVLEMSHTCYNGKRQMRFDWGYGCGVCPACELRKNGYAEYLKSKH